MNRLFVRGTAIVNSLRSQCRYQSNNNFSPISSSEYRAAVNLQNIRASLLRQSPRTGDQSDDVSTYYPNATKSSRVYRTALDRLFNSLSNALFNHPIAQTGRHTSSRAEQEWMESVIDNLIAPLDTDLGLDFCATTVPELSDTLDRHISLSGAGTLEFSRQLLRPPTTDFFREAMDRLLVSFDLRSTTGRRQLVELMMMEAFLMRRQSKSATETQQQRQNSSSVDPGKFNQRGLMLLSRLNCGIQSDCPVEISVPNRLEVERKEQWIHGTVDYLTTAHFTRNRPLPSKPHYPSRALCALMIVKHSDDLLHQFHANKPQFQSLLYSLLHPPPNSFDTDWWLRPLNLCLTDGIRWQFVRFYPRYSDILLPFTTSPATINSNPTNTMDTEDDENLLSIDAHELSPLDRITVRQMFDKNIFDDLSQRTGGGNVGGGKNELLEYDSKILERLVSEMNSLNTATATAAVDVKYFISNQYDLSNDDGYLVMGILQWWLRGLSPYSAAYNEKRHEK